MKAAPADQKLLLDLQAVDSGLDRVAHQRRTHPAIAAAAAAEKKAAALRDDLVVAETVLADLALDSGRLEADVDGVRARQARNEKLLIGGTLGAKEITGIQHEQQTLERRQGVLEDELLELMEKVEEREGVRAGLQERAAGVAAELQEATDERDAAWAVLDSEAGLLRTDRDRVAGLVPAELSALYEKLRSTKQGVGAALLERRRCGGCHLEIQGDDLREVAAAAADDVVRCPECGRILVRTEVSGL